MADASGAQPGPGRYRNPVYDGYFADPFILRSDDGYVAYGTGATVDDRHFEVLTSPDLSAWQRAGGALVPAAAELGTTYWAPEVVSVDGRYWMYYSVGHDDVGHQIRVAASASPLGPFVDQGVNLTPDERFAIDPHPFRDTDGTWYLYFARDVLDGPRVGTHLAVDVLTTMTTVAGRPVPVLAPHADWQIYQRDRAMYGAVYDWHTLEGPSVRRHDGRYYCFYSGGSWQGPGYAVAYAVADTALGPWREPPSGGRLLWSRPPHVSGPGHNSILETAGGTEMVVYHAWDEPATARRMCLDRLLWTADGPSTDGPTWTDQSLPT